MTSVLIGFLALLFLANPNEKQSVFGVKYQVSNIYYEAPQYNFSYGYVPEGEAGHVDVRFYNAAGEELER